MQIKGNPVAVYDSNGSAILLHMRTGKHLMLNSTAGHFWRYLQDGSTFNDALRFTATHFGIDPDTFHVDMKPTLEKLQEHGFLKHSPGHQPSYRRLLRRRPR
jgi:hypothetical protein